MKAPLKLCLGIWALSMIVLGSQVLGAVQSWGQINNHGTVVAVGVEVSPTTLDWGKVEHNVTVTRSFDVVNTGNAPLTLLIAMSNFNPVEFPLNVVFNHNYAGAVIGVDGIYTVAVDMTVNPDMPMNITAFSFTINVDGIEA